MVAVTRMSDPFRGGGVGNADRERERKKDVEIIKRGIENQRVSSETIGEIARRILKEAPEAATPVPDAEKKK